MQHSSWSGMGSTLLRCRSIFDVSKNGAQKGPFVAEDAACRFGKGEGSLAFLVGQDLPPIGFIGSQAGKTEQGDSKSVRPFMREKIAMVDAAEAVHQRNPQARVDFEIRHFVRINDGGCIDGWCGVFSFNQIGNISFE